MVESPCNSAARLGSDQWESVAGIPIPTGKSLNTQEAHNAQAVTARTNRWSCASLEGATSATLFIVHALERSAAATRRRWPRGLGLACEAKGCWVETARAACFLYRHRRYAGSTPTGLVCDWVDNCQRRSMFRLTSCGLGVSGRDLGG